MITIFLKPIIAFVKNNPLPNANDFLSNLWVSSYRKFVCRLYISETINQSQTNMFSSIANTMPLHTNNTVDSETLATFFFLVRDKFVYRWQLTGRTSLCNGRRCLVPQSNSERNYICDSELNYRSRYSWDTHRHTSHTPINKHSQ